MHIVVLTQFPNKLEEISDSFSRELITLWKSRNLSGKIFLLVKNTDQSIICSTYIHIQGCSGCMHYQSFRRTFHLILRAQCTQRRYYRYHLSSKEIRECIYHSSYRSAEDPGSSDVSEMRYQRHVGCRCHDYRTE